MKNNKTPSIRFKGFTDPWEQRKLGDIVGIYDGVHQTPNYQNSGVMFLSVENIATLKSSKFISEEDFKRNYKIFPQENDILMTRIGDVGTTNVVTDNSLKAYYVSLALLKYKSTDPYFLSNAIQSDYVQKGLANRTLKTAIPMKINKDEIGKVSVMLPLSATEQQQIGTYFRNLDNLITLHQRKYNKLLNVKKSMLEKMFPKNGSNIPEIRFKGFTDPWEQRKVLDLLELLTDYDANGSFADMAKNINTTDGDGYAWYVRITDLENPKPLSELKYVDESSYEFLKKTELHGGELLMAKRGNIGKVYIFEPRTKYATVAPNMYLLKLNNKVIPHFLYDYFVSEEGNKKLTRLNASSTMGALYKDDVKNIDVIMPSIEEQAMIGNFFQSIDHIITLHQRELEKLQNIKKSMLEKMFV